MKITELTPGKKVVWHVLESKLSKDEKWSEWDGTKLIFEITKDENKTKIQFTHFGLVPQLECYTICSKSWDFYIKSSLQKLIATNKGQPIKKG